jgi:hypothetical protein
LCTALNFDRLHLDEENGLGLETVDLQLLVSLQAPRALEEQESGEHLLSGVCNSVLVARKEQPLLQPADMQNSNQIVGNMNISKIKNVSR